jgi:hypothetical protein
MHIYTITLAFGQWEKAKADFFDRAGSDIRLILAAKNIKVIAGSRQDPNLALITCGLHRNV